MIKQIALITILTDDVPRLCAFYRDVLGFAVQQDFGYPDSLPSRNMMPGGLSKLKVAVESRR